MSTATGLVYGSAAPVREFGDAGVLRAALLAELGSDVRTAIAARGRALLALSGGRTPLPLYEALASLDLDWPRVTFALVDERWVDTGSVDSNEHQLRHALAAALDAGARLVGMKNDAPSAALGLARCEAIYHSLALPFDLVLLGMGEDGHTASLFPGAAGLEQALDPRAGALCAAITARPGPVSGALLERMSLTRAGILRARRIELLLTGAAKRKVLEQALAGTDAAGMPVRAVLQQQEVPLQIWWAP